VGLEHQIKFDTPCVARTQEHPPHPVSLISSGRGVPKHPLGFLTSLGSLSIALQETIEFCLDTSN
jgi:hypothetical protein